MATSAGTDKSIRGTNKPEGALQAFRKSKIAVPFALVLTALISFALLVFGGAAICFVPLLISIMAYGIPWYFGLKDRKKLAVFGLVLLLFLGISTGVTYYFILKDQQPVELSSSNNVLTQGQVEPFRGDVGATYHFSVVLNNQTANANSTPDVYVVVFNYWQGYATTRFNMTEDHSAGLPSPQRLFVVNTSSLAKGGYQMAFYYKNQINDITVTSFAWGPFLVTDQEILIHELEYRIFWVFIQIGLVFYMLLLLTWWMDSSRKRVDQMQKKKLEQEKGAPAQGPIEKFVCSECGADVPLDAKECPQCGDKFEDGVATPTQGDKPGEFVCSDCGKPVKETDEKCGNCGKKFDN